MPSSSPLHLSSFFLPPSSFLLPSSGPYDDKLKQGGEPCRQNLECETGVCKGNWHGLRTGVCTGTGHGNGGDIASMPGSLGAFSPCRHNKDCKTHLCENNWGGIRIGTCAETPSGHTHGERCKHNAECGSGVCAGNWGGMREGRCATEPGRASAALAGAAGAGDKRYVGQLAAAAKAQHGGRVQAPGGPCKSNEDCESRNCAGNWGGTRQGRCADSRQGLLAHLMDAGQDTISTAGVRPGSFFLFFLEQSSTTRASSRAGNRASSSASSRVSSSGKEEDKDGASLPRSPSSSTLPNSRPSFVALTTPLEKPLKMPVCPRMNHTCWDNLLMSEWSVSQHDPLNEGAGVGDGRASTDADHVQHHTTHGGQAKPAGRRGTGRDGKDGRAAGGSRMGGGEENEEGHDEVFVQEADQQAWRRQRQGYEQAQVQGQGQRRRRRRQLLQRTPGSAGIIGAMATGVASSGAPWATHVSGIDLRAEKNTPPPSNGGGGRCGDKDYEMQQAAKKQCGETCRHDKECSFEKCKGASWYISKLFGRKEGKCACGPDDNDKLDSTAGAVEDAAAGLSDMMRKMGGEGCRENAECASGLCKGNWGGLKLGSCTDANACLPGHARCRHRVQCCSQTCQGNFGGLREGKCADDAASNGGMASNGFKEMGEPCRVNDDCASGTCHSGTCSNPGGKMPGMPCMLDKECTTGWCKGNWGGVKSGACADMLGGLRGDLATAMKNRAGWQGQAAQYSHEFQDMSKALAQKGMKLPDAQFQGASDM